jgi:hypothetical protein
MSVSCCPSQKLGDREIVGDRELELFAIVAEPAGVARLLLFARLERLEPSGLCDRLFVARERSSGRAGARVVAASFFGVFQRCSQRFMYRYGARTAPPFAA